MHLIEECLVASSHHSVIAGQQCLSIRLYHLKQTYIYIYKFKKTFIVARGRFMHLFLLYDGFATFDTTNKGLVLKLVSKACTRLERVGILAQIL